eukprot:3440998-Rhodomonas_salina.2
MFEPPPRKSLALFYQSSRKRKGGGALRSRKIATHYCGGVNLPQESYACGHCTAHAVHPSRGSRP